MFRISMEAKTVSELGRILRRLRLVGLVREASVTEEIEFIPGMVEVVKPSPAPAKKGGGTKTKKFRIGGWDTPNDEA